MTDKERNEQLKNLRLLVAQMLDTLEADITIYHDLPERQEVFALLDNYRRSLKEKLNDKEPYVITAEQIKEFQAQLTHYRVCRVKCKCCGDVLEHVNRTKEPQSHRMLTCTCGKVQLDPHVFAYRINGYPEDYEDLSEKWPEKE